MTQRCLDEIVITGMAAATPLGKVSDSLWSNLIEGSTHFQKITHFDPLRARDHLIGLISDASADLPPLGHSERLSQILAQTVSEALANARLMGRSDRKIGLVLGMTDVGGAAAKEAFANYRAGALASPVSRAAFNGFHAQALAEKLNLTGPCFTLGNASAASAVAIGMARDLLFSGECDAVVAAGGDGITESAFQGLFSLRTLAPEGCRPFHPARRGIRISEAAGAMVLEVEKVARKRGASIEGAVSGYGASHISANPARPDPAGVAQAIRIALSEASLNPSDIGYVNLHGAGTIHGDLAEIQALREVFGEGLKALPLSSSKPSLGHCQGAAGILEALVVLLAIQNQVAPPTVGLLEIDPEFQNLNLFSKPKEARGLKHGLSISCGLGGTNTATLMSQRSSDL